MKTNYEAISNVFTAHHTASDLVLGGNAIRVLKLYDHPGQEEERKGKEDDEATMQSTEL